LLFSPRETKRLATSDLLGQSGLSGIYGGISFSVPALASAVSAVHLVYDEASKYSRSMEMMRRDPSATVQERTGKAGGMWATPGADAGHACA
jgi:hypothetical protein